MCEHMLPSSNPVRREAKLRFVIKSRNSLFYQEGEAANTDNGMLCYLSGPPMREGPSR